MELMDLRKKIDGIDDELLALFEKRMGVIIDVAAFKKSKNMPVLDRAREAEKLAAAAAKASPEMQKYARILFAMLINLGRKYQHENLFDASAPMYEYRSALVRELREAKAKFAGKEFPTTTMIACQGVEGSFAELAAEKLFRQPTAIQYMKTYDSVFSAIENGFCEYGVLPLENSTAGSVNKVYRAMQNHKFRIARSIRLKIDHHLVAPEGVSLDDIREVVSHEQALAQCDEFLSSLSKKHEIMQTQYNNTAAAAEMVATGTRRDVAAICSRRSADQYGLKILQKNIQDNPNNFTRFICISKNLEIYDGANLTDMILTLKNEQGILHKVLSKINTLGIDLTKLESRPTESDEDFMFYVTFKTAVNDDLFALLDELTELCKNFEFLGSYTEVL
ncbi:MAG: chorismate mutase [Defluviitaleaceae bacterium]|nr:chorismate mutase [Defluviitaleaceae bacterium]